MRISFKPRVQYWDEHRATRVEMYVEDKLVGEYVADDNQNKRPFYFLKGLYVYGINRRKGYGKKLLANAITLAKRRKFKSIKLLVFKKHPFTIEWYKRNGFKIMDVECDEPMYYWMELKMNN